MFGTVDQNLVMSPPAVVPSALWTGTTTAAWSLARGGKKIKWENLNSVDARMKPVPRPLRGSRTGLVSSL